MAEVHEEASHVWSHKARIALFFSAMRHFYMELVERGFNVRYYKYGEHSYSSIASCIGDIIDELSPSEVLIVQPGEHRVLKSIAQRVSTSATPLVVLSDNHFVVPLENFDAWARGRKVFRLEHFYRLTRRQTNILMEKDQPTGGKWNFDVENRSSFPKGGPPFSTDRLTSPIDQTTRDVIELVNEKFANHPGTLDDFRWPTTRDDALLALDDFIENHLEHFGKYQDAMWQNEPLLGHSLISSALNLKLLDPLEVCNRAEAAFLSGKAPIESVEGFIRQIIGWREYVRCLYFFFGEEWTKWNHLGANGQLPKWYWTGEVDMVCLADTIGQTIKYGYAHHIQRLMVTGLFALLWGANPYQVHEWYLSIYVDAVEWVEAPNVIGMSQYADGGVMASKPYIASGAYISKMSNYCSSCRYSPAEATGEAACPFTTLYWDFIERHQELLNNHPRLGLQVKNLERKSQSERIEIKARARELRQIYS